MTEHEEPPRPLFRPTSVSNKGQMMRNFKQDILQVAGNEPILAIAVSAYRSYYYEKSGTSSDHTLGSLPVPWSVAAPVLDYEYDDGYGGQDCHDIWAWTATRVLSIHEYDGSTCVIAVARNPENFAPGNQ